ncbi:MAG: LppX_LprAFG lipoprotein [Chloroflexota bacterium]|nr:LppX_LprAFG lipoprotein [Chloroflexota bacterium]
MTTSDNPREHWFHPLISGVDPSLNRRRLVLLGTSGLVATIIARTEPGSASAQEATPDATPRATPGVTSLGGEVTGEPEAVELLRNAANAMAALSTFAFEIETTRGESTIFQGLNVREINGFVRRPVDFTATVVVDVPFGSLDVTAIGVDGMAWVQDPLSDTESWIPLEGAENIVALINPDALIVSSIGLIQDARLDGTENVDGVDTTRVAGTVDFADTAERVTGGSVQLPAEIVAEPLPVTVWIDGEGRVLEIEVVGQIVLTESEDVVRAVRFFGFNEPVDIAAPPV